MPETLLLHATTVAIGGRAVLLRGASGSGKSDLALRLIDAGARLVADDRSELRRDGGAVLVSAPATIAGLVEARGLGILRLDSLAVARLSLIVDLVAPEAIDRLPEKRSEAILGNFTPADRIGAVRGFGPGQATPRARRAGRRRNLAASPPLIPAAHPKYRALDQGASLPPNQAW